MILTFHSPHYSKFLYAISGEGNISYTSSAMAVCTEETEEETGELEELVPTHCHPILVNNLTPAASLWQLAPALELIILVPSILQKQVFLEAQFSQY
jgi:hypothetical protein